MAKFPTMDEFAKSVAEKAFDDYMYEGKTIREWTELLLKGDVVEVVRCKDCKHFTEGMAIGMCKRLEDKPILPIRYDHFCSYGERRLDE